MAKKNNTLTIAVILILLVGGYLIYNVQGRNVPDSTSEGGLQLNACVSDAEGNCLSEPSLSVVTIGGNAPIVGARYLTIFSTFTATGNVPVIDINSISSSQALYNSEIQNQMTTSFSLNQGETNEQSVTIDFTDPLVPNGVNTFDMVISATFKDASGNDVPVSPQPVASISILKEDDTCSDGTPWGSCSPNQPTYCEPGRLADDPLGYADGNLVEKASQCGCPEGYIVNGDSCSLNACSDGTSVGSCSVFAGTNARYCDENRQLVEACDICGGASQCTNDYYGNQAESCSNPGATDGTDVCEYTDYSGNIDITIGGSGSSPPPEPPPLTTGVIFRGIGILGGRYQAIAYTNSCGNSLTAYGQTGTNEACGTPILTDNLGKQLCTSTDPSGIVYDGRKYTTSDSDASLVNVGANPLPDASEVTCQY